jgi:hypothetical protein
MDCFWKYFDLLSAASRKRNAHHDGIRGHMGVGDARSGFISQRLRIRRAYLPFGLAEVLAANGKAEVKVITQHMFAPRRCFVRRFHPCPTHEGIDSTTGGISGRLTLTNRELSSNPRTRMKQSVAGWGENIPRAPRA